MKILSLAIFFISLSASASMCDADKKKFCHNLTGARGEVARCLTDHKSELSPACAQELKEFRKKAAEKNPCYQDLADYCPDVPSSKKNIQLCLLKNESRLSPACLQDFKVKAKPELSKDVCSSDIVSHCSPEINKPRAAINRCLIRSVKKLSPLCQKQTTAKIEELKKKNPCFNETEKFCPSQVSFVEIQECLEKKLPQLNATCKKIVSHEQSLSLANPCYKDLRKFCRRDITPEQQDICLDINQGSVSAACQSFRQEEVQKIEKIKVACEMDRLKFCKTAPFKGGAILQCLRAQKKSLSKDCQSLL